MLGTGPRAKSEDENQVGLHGSSGSCRLPRGCAPPFRTLRSNGALCCGMAGSRRSTPRSSPCLTRQRLARSSRTTFTLQRAGNRAGATRCRALRSAPCGSRGVRRATLRPGRRTCWRRWQLYPRTSCLRQADGNGLLRRARAVLPFANMVYLLANEFAGLRGGRLAGSLILMGSLKCGFLGHNQPSGQLEDATLMPSQDDVRSSTKGLRSSLSPTGSF
jgi:hypothetical protein